MKKLILTFFGVLFFLSFAEAKDIEGKAVLLRGVDKITGRTSTIELAVGEPANFGTLRITPLRCLKKPPEETPENAAFLLVEEETREHILNVIFNGWMFSSNPALSAMEHPIFDIWVLECLADETEEQITPIKTPVSTNPVNINALGEI